MEPKKLVWSLVAASLNGDHDGREALLEEVEDLEQALDLITGLTATTAGILRSFSRSNEQALDAVRDFLFQAAAEEENDDGKP